VAGLITPASAVGDLIDQRPLAPVQWWVLALCTLVVLLDGFDVQAAAFTGPALAVAWQIDRASLGPVFAAGLAGMAVGALLIGPLGDRYGRRPALLLSVAAFGTCTLLTAWTENVEQLVGMRFLTGVGLGGALPNTTALISEYAPRRHRNLCVAVTFLGIPLGGLIGGLLASWLVPRFGWPAVYIAGGLAPLALLPLLWRTLPESIGLLLGRGDTGQALAVLRRIDPQASLPNTPMDGAPKPAGFPVKALFEPGYAGDTLKLWAAFFANLIAVYFLISWIPSLVVEAGFDLRYATWASVALNLGGAVGPLILARFTARHGTRFMLPGILLLAALSVVVTGRVGQSLLALLLLVFCCGFFSFGGQIGLNTLTAYIYPTRARSTGVGWALGIGRIGSILGPLVGGVLLQMKLGLPSYFLAFGMLLVAAAVATFVIRRQQPAA
jgi:AAHS family 4-hydroxybenzoate transporter-like MFS transporter